MKNLNYNSEIVKDGVIAIDGASVATSIAINNDGTANRLINSQNLNSKFSKILKESIYVISSFVELYKDNIIKYYFVGYFCPVSPEFKPFPILMQKATSCAGKFSIKSCETNSLDAQEGIES